MAIKYGFYNSISGDRKYNAEDFGKIFDGIIRDGIFESIYDKFQITIMSGLSVSVGKGKAWFNNTWLENDANYPVSFTAAEVLLNRIDAVVLEFDSTEGVRANSIKVITGTPGSTPQKPTLTRTDTINQYPLCYVTIPAKATSITTANLDIRIGTIDCPYAVIESGEIPSLAEINKLINDVAALDTKVDDTVEGLSYLDKNGDGAKVLTNDGTYKSISPVLLATLTTSGIFNPADFPTTASKYTFVLYGGGGGGGASYREEANTYPIWVGGNDGGGGGAGGKTIIPKIKVTMPTTFVIGSGANGDDGNYTPAAGGDTSILGHSAGGGQSGGRPKLTANLGEDNIYGYIRGSGGSGGEGTISKGANGSGGYGGKNNYGGDSEVGTGGKNGGNATGYGAGGGGGLDNGSYVEKNPGGKGAPGVIYVYGYNFDMEV